MVTHLYKLECLTNLHVGSGEANYNIVDNEVERDPITEYPIIHASGLKGALREYFKEILSTEQVERVFGKPTTQKETGAGLYKFFDAHILSRPMRVSGGNLSSVPVTTTDMIQSFLDLTNAFGCNPYPNVNLNAFEELDFGENEFLASKEGIRVEDEDTGLLPDKWIAELKPIFGETFAIANDFNSYALPVVAHNQLEDRISKNLWYEEYVPHGSVFYFIICTPDENMVLDFAGRLIQFGANASIGYGYTKLTKLN